MSINRRSALGAMIGGMAAGPEAAKAVVDTVAKAAGDGLALQSAAFSGISETLDFPLAKLERIASGNISDEDYDESPRWMFDYVPPRSLPTDYEANLHVLKSVSPQARRAIAHGRRVGEARRDLVRKAIKTLMSLRP